MARLAKWWVVRKSRYRSPSSWELRRKDLGTMETSSSFHPTKSAAQKAGRAWAKKFGTGGRGGNLRVRNVQAGYVDGRGKFHRSSNPSNKVLGIPIPQNKWAKALVRKTRGGIQLLLKDIPVAGKVLRRLA